MENLLTIIEHDIEKIEEKLEDLNAIKKHIIERRKNEQIT
jgi:hypothetical protein